jgi:SAM-dependent methyltransferase
LITQSKESKFMGTAKVQGELWGNAPQDWATIQEPNHEPLREAMLAATKVGPGTRFLDAGCGTGAISVSAVERGAQVSGIDAAENMIAYVQQRIPQGDFRVGDIEFLPFADDTFDVVCAMNSVQYAAEPVAALRGFGRVCRPRGYIVASLFAAPEKVAVAAVGKAMAATMPEPPKSGGPFKLSMPGKLEELFAEAGLTVLESSEVNCPLRYPDFDTFWQGRKAAGPTQAMLRVVGEERLKMAAREAVEPFQQADGRIVIQPNFFKYVVAAV